MWCASDSLIMCLLLLCCVGCCCDFKSRYFLISLSPDDATRIHNLHVLYWQPCIHQMIPVTNLMEKQSLENWYLSKDITPLNQDFNYSMHHSQQKLHKCKKNEHLLKVHNTIPINNLLIRMLPNPIQWLLSVMPLLTLLVCASPIQPSLLSGCSPMKL